MDGELQLEVQRRSDLPLYLSIARSLAQAIESGRLSAGAKLPSTRRLAEMLEVQRNTAVAAYEELEAEGWIVGRARAGTFVAEDTLPQLPTDATSPGHRCAFPLGEAPHPKLSAPTTPARYVLSGGVPDLGLVPRHELTRAYRRALSQQPKLLDYADPAGHAGLRERIAELVVRQRGLRATPDQVLITSGAQMALYLTGQALLRGPNPAHLAVENLGYPPAWAAFETTGAQLHGLPVDEGGLRVDALEALVAALEKRGERLSGVYVTPHHQYPTMVLMSPSRRLALLALAEKHRFAVIEDDYDHEIHYSGQPVLPLASRDRRGSVVYVGTLSKVLAPGLRLGYVVGPRPLIQRLAELRLVIDRQGHHALEAAVAELFEDGEIQRHVRRARKHYRLRREALTEALRDQLGDVLRFGLPPGGLALWARVQDGFSSEGWAQRARTLGVAITPGGELSLDRRSLPFLRLGFAAHSPDRLVEAVQLMKAAL